MSNPLGPTVLGYPRIGGNRELKRAVEGYWAGRVDAAQLAEVAATIRTGTWTALRDAGLASVPSNTFSYYDHVLDSAVMVDAVPDRYRALGLSSLDTYFAMARGTDQVAPLELTKWFDTNYHYLVPELGPDTRFAARPDKPVAELAEAAAQGVPTRPVLVGPVTLLLLAKPALGAPAGFLPLDLLDPLLDCYAEILTALRDAGADWVQLDEPAFVADRSAGEIEALRRAYQRLGGLTGRPDLFVASYFGDLGEAMPVLLEAPVQALGLDLVAGPRNLELLARYGPARDRTVVAGVVDGRNVWRTDLPAALSTAATLLGSADRVTVASSCSLLHVPLDLAAESDLDPALVARLAFARQKVDEVVALDKAPPVPAAGRRAGRPAEAAAAAHHHHRLVPADRAGARRPGRPAGRPDRRGHLPAADARRDRQGGAAAGAARPGRAGARRAGAQRHGAVLRRAPRRVRRHRERVGPVVRVAVCAAADPLR